MLPLILRRREGGRHTREELQFIATAAASGVVPDYQLAAWLMAAYLRPLTEQETSWLTIAMAESGERLDLSGLPKPWIDKHSTGGVGDKTTIVLLPLLAACGLTVVKMSGRGLGITGGTVDKLASVPGFRLDLSPKEMIGQAALIGVALTGQTPSLAPADKALYSLRDATGTVDSIPLIVSSILSKKIAGGAETVVFDIKCGSGAFMTSPADAALLRAWLERIGKISGLNVRCAISDMEQPLGSAVGNALEVREAIGVLRNEALSPPVARFRELCIGLAALTLQSCGIEASPDRAYRMAHDQLASDAAERKARAWFEAQGADAAVFDAPRDHLPTAQIKAVVESEREGWVESVDARVVGETALELGAGRHKKEDAIDHAVGIEVLLMVGDKVAKGQPAFRIHSSSEEKLATARSRLSEGIRVSRETCQPRPLFIEVEPPSAEEMGR